MNTTIQTHPPESLLAMVKSDPLRIYSRSDVLLILQTPSPFFAEVFFTISESNQTIYKDSYEDTVMYRNRDSFTEEEIYYFCEGIKIQISRGYSDFYYIIHHFMRDLGYECLKRLLLFLLDNEDYRIREYIVTWNITGSIDTSNLFGLKILRKLASSESEIIHKELEKRSRTVDRKVN